MDNSNIITRLFKITLFVILCFGLFTAQTYAASNQWISLGGALSGGNTWGTKIAMYNGTSYVAYSDGANGGKATVKRFDGINWV